jgi:predicted ATPase with chaperone activity
MSGEVSLAHHSVLFLDELPEFRCHVLKVLRHPLENGVTNIRSHGCPKSKWFYNLSRKSNEREGGEQGP